MGFTKKLFFKVTKTFVNYINYAHFTIESDTARKLFNH